MKCFDILKNSLTQDSHYLFEEINNNFEKLKQLQIEKIKAWDSIPKNCPFYEMAPDKYDHYYSISHEISQLCELVVEKIMTIDLCYVDNNSSCDSGI